MTAVKVMRSEGDELTIVVVVVYVCQVLPGHQDNAGHFRPGYERHACWRVTGLFTVLLFEKVILPFWTSAHTSAYTVPSFCSHSWIILILILIHSCFCAPPTAHYTVQFKSAIPELGTVGSLEQERFEGTLVNRRGTHQLEFCWQPVPC